MVRTRSGKRPIVFEKTAFAKRCCLRGSDVRKRAGDEELSCSICLVSLYYSSDVRPKWNQCEHCKTVFHEMCLLKYAARSTATFDCPHCRHTYPCTIFDTNANAWSAEDLIDDLMDQQDEDYVGQSEASFSDYDSDDESEEEDEEHESYANAPAVRFLRSANK
jgi:hypothetical protein